ncbi:hypothetical protein MUK42_03698 [Musa troglodytarum]|uniref:Protein kinase domain-containing protein n=1 Tax=Musa troglodytarum TaxID=320322 RepID=A0A9E7G215_9LILI|nr:hypothetical protein MUK42_03698 [Musa troglodytarum]
MEMLDPCYTAAHGLLLSPACNHATVIEQLNRAHELTSQLQALLLPLLPGCSWSELALAQIREMIRCYTSALSRLQSAAGGCWSTPSAVRSVDDRRGSGYSSEEKRKNLDGDWPHNRKRRSYLRCTYSTDQGCQARKTVQKDDSDADPPNYLVVYTMTHTCKNVVETNFPSVTESLVEKSAASYDHRRPTSFVIQEQHLCPPSAAAPNHSQSRSIPSFGDQEMVHLLPSEVTGSMRRRDNHPAPFIMSGQSSGEVSPDSPLDKRMRNLVFYLASLLLFCPLPAKSGSPGLNDDVLGLIVFKADILDPLSKLASWNEDEDDPCGWTGVKCNAKTNRVTELSLVGFSLSGKIGRGLLQLQSIQKLYLSKNNFSGSLNPKLSQLESLRVVDLGENNLSGVIPDEFFGQCRSLRSLSLANNAFSGHIPSSLGSCSTLAALNLSSNRLSGSLPKGLWSLYGLRSLDLSGNSLVGEIPGGISRLYNLRSISLRQNRLSGRLPDDMGSCLLLKYLDFSVNFLTGSLPDSMHRLSMCGHLRLASNLFSGKVPTWIGEMKNLEFLDLSRNWFSGRVPDSIGKLQLLKSLDLSRNRLAGGLPESIGACRGLTDLDLSGVSATGDRTLSCLDLSGNAFSGAIPLVLGNLLSLQQLNLSWNLLSGSIPARLETVQVLDLSRNLINGSIPPEIGKAVSLKELRLEKNSLTGEIPVQIGNCSSLTTMMLSQNNLTGPLPPTLANLTNLHKVDLSFNRLSGNLPKQLSNLPHLLSFDISHNLFSGDLPAGNFFNTIPPSSLSDNPGLCGSAVNRSCPTVLPKPIVLNPNSSTSSAVTFLNMRVRASTDPHSAAALALSDGYYSNSPSTDANSGKLVMFSGSDPNFSARAHAVLNKDCELGRGGFGAVYKTILRDGRPVVIKKLTVSSLVKSQEDFEREVKKLGKLRHSNLVALEGYYWTQSLQLLIYEFVSSGSLHKHLHECSTSNPFSWQERFDIILGIARSLAYLHRLNVIHYNLKSSNILIDGSEGRVDELVDGRLGGKFPAEEAVPVVKLGLICTSQVPSNRLA